jgi:hypothetical protein
MKSLYWFTILPVLLLLGITSCNDANNSFGPERKKAVEQFVQHLKNNNPQGVYEMTWHGDMPDNITNEELRRRDVVRASEMISQYGLPPRQQWRYTADTGNAAAPYSVTITLLEKSNTEQARIYIAFPPPEVSDKIYRYIIIGPDPSPIEKDRPV